MKIYTHYSESHVPLLVRHFQPSVPSGFELILKKMPQHCPTGQYAQTGWSETMMAKATMILTAIEHERENFAVCDADHRFYRLSPDDLALPPNVDVAYALDFPLSKRDQTPHYCTGFAVIRPSPRTRDLYQRILSLLPELQTEQKSLNRVLPQLKGTVRVIHLPPDRFWSLPHPIPESYDLAACHASWVKGVEAKVSFLDAVKNLVETFPCS